jgi:hypothetical protein
MKEPRLKDCTGLPLPYKIFYVAMLVSTDTLQPSVKRRNIREAGVEMTLAAKWRGNG